MFLENNQTLNFWKLVTKAKINFNGTDKLSESSKTST